MFPNATSHDVEEPVDPVSPLPFIPANAQPRIVIAYELANELIKKNRSNGRIFMQKY